MLLVSQGVLGRDPRQEGSARCTMRATQDPQYIEFISRLRTLRKSLGISQAELAELLNRPQSYVSKVETCERRIDVIEAARLCLVLGVSLHEALPAELQGTGHFTIQKQPLKGQP